jgi:inositol-phosphate phosphatase / L-galactose 1-phosphate phosphatase / histidinol-phosphatase
MSVGGPIYRDFLETAIALADLARPIARKYFRQPLDIASKRDASPVTIADQEIEATMVQYLRRKFPTHGIYGEEHGTHQLDAEYVWVLDPIDGTKSFITGRATFGTLIALAHHGKPVLGIIDQAITDERWVGCIGLPTTFNGRPVRVKPEVALIDAIAATTTPLMWAGHEAAHARFQNSVKAVAYGGDCYAYAMLAMGFVDVIAETDLKPYDFMALVPVVEGAGGVMTDWDGGTLSIASAGNVLTASGRSLIQQLRHILK